ncbi:MAG TPA: hypothetical protein VJ957_04680 [Longimicrobiales bacterium]|nr:hypothetical protein [Longimicrobiales bacterium]
MTNPGGGGSEDGWVRSTPEGPGQPDRGAPIGGTPAPGAPGAPGAPPQPEAGEVGPAHDWPRTAFILLLALYGAVLIKHYGTYGFMDNVDLPIHEAGHIFFSPFGEFIQFLGGTLMQLLVPSVFFAYFLIQGNRYAATVILWWIAQNLWNISVYIRDTRTQLLPLVGGGEHDWAYLLGRLGVTQYDQQIAGTVRFAGILIFLASILLGLHYAGWRLTAAPAADERTPGERP